MNAKYSLSKSFKSAWVLKEPCVSTSKACDGEGVQNRTRTCSIESENNEELLEEVSPNPCALPTCHFKMTQPTQISPSNLVATLPARPDSSKAIFRQIFTSYFYD